MLDLVSTREDAGPATRSCCRLIAAIIAQAVRDAATPPDANEKAKTRNLNGPVVMALEFLFDERNSVFPAYAKMIGLSAESIRRGLMRPPELLETTDDKKRAFTERDRRVIQLRLRWRKISGPVCMKEGMYDYAEAA